MLNPEDFRRQLNQSLARKRQDDQATATKESGRKQRAKKTENQLKTSREIEERQKNQVVLRLDSQLPIREYLNVLKNKIVPLEYIRRFGPNKGDLAYGFIYGGGIRKIVISSQTSSVSGRHGINSHTHTVTESVTRMARDVVGVILNHEGFIDFVRAECVVDLSPIKNHNGGLICPNSINPLRWSGKSFATVNINSEGGLQRFTQTLTDFYVGLKTGQGK